LDSRAFPAFFLALGLAAARPAAANPPSDESVESWRQKVVVYHDLNAAQTLTSDEALQARLRAGNEKDFQLVFDEALSMIDLKQTLEKDRLMGGDIRFHLFGRPNCRLCGDPQGIHEWIEKYRIRASQEKLSVAVWDWPKLSAERRKCLAAGGRDERSWERTTLFQRREVLRDCAASSIAIVEGPFPRDQAAFDAMMTAAKSCADVLFVNEFVALGDKLNKAESLLKAQSRAKSLAGTGDAAAVAALQAAQDAKDPDAAAAALQSYFDHSADHAAGTPHPGYAADSGDAGGRYRVLASMMQGALMKTVQGTWAGDDLNAFYKDHPLRVEILPLDRAWALYDPARGSIVLSRSAIDQLLLDQGLTLEDAVRSPQAAGLLAVGFSSVFVHETTHQRTHAWEEANGLRAFPAADDEQAAMENEALFLIEKFRRDLNFVKAYERVADPGHRLTTRAAVIGIGDKGPVNVALDSMRMAMRFRDSPDSFRAIVRGDMYAYREGNEGVADDEYARLRARAESYEAELRRRAGLPAGAQADLASLPRPAALDDGRSWAVEPYGDVSTAALREWDERARKEADAVQTQYVRYRQRADAATAEADKRRKALDGFFLPSRPRATVPPPEGI